MEYTSKRIGRETGEIGIKRWINRSLDRLRERKARTPLTFPSVLEKIAYVS